MFSQREAFCFSQEVDLSSVIFTEEVSVGSFISSSTLGRGNVVGLIVAADREEVEGNSELTNTLTEKI
jgi:hypothetical protein